MSFCVNKEYDMYVYFYLHKTHISHEDTIKILFKRHLNVIQTTVKKINGNYMEFCICVQNCLIISHASRSIPKVKLLK